MLSLIRGLAWIIWLVWGAASAYLAYDINQSVADHSARWSWFLMILVAFAGVTLVCFLVAQARGRDEE
ncbi:MAG TPA: hypothetical protein PLL10_10195 [Elusimicrobiales bacterium]|nr:hypothetical protein [Elusimicrobiales bacterium]